MAALPRHLNPTAARPAFAWLPNLACPRPLVTGQISPWLPVLAMTIRLRTRPDFSRLDCRSKTQLDTARRASPRLGFTWLPLRSSLGHSSSHQNPSRARLSSAAMSHAGGTEFRSARPNPKLLPELPIGAVGTHSLATDLTANATRRRTSTPLTRVSHPSFC